MPEMPRAGDLPPRDTPVRTERRAARALLFNPGGELLLIKYRNDPGLQQRGRADVLADYWGTIGGGIDPEEDIHQALRREIAEEIGHRNVTIGPEVWRRHADMMHKDKNLRLTEHYLVAHTPDIFIDSGGQTEHERKALLEIRWWQPADIAAAPDVILPPFLRAHIGDIAAGRYPATVMLFDETVGS